MHEQCVEHEKESFSLWWWYQHNEDLLIGLFWGVVVCAFIFAGPIAAKLGEQL